MTASLHADWQDLVAALAREIDLVRALRDLAQAAREPLARIDVPKIQLWVEHQRSVLADLDSATKDRQTAQQRLHPAGASGQHAVFGFRAMIDAAPEALREHLVAQHQELRSLRDELGRHSGRNEAMCRQVLTFTEQVGKSMAERDQQPSYQQLGLRASLNRLSPQTA